jgi:hypothetical protein
MEDLGQELQRLGFDELYHDNLHTLISCKLCGSVLREPVTTQCGASYCRPCLLSTKDQDVDVFCPVDQCRQYYRGDCPVDITLQTVVLAVKGFLKTRSIQNGSPGHAGDTILRSESGDMRGDETLVDSNADVNLLSKVQETLKEDTSIMKCVICFHRYLHPVTTRCGHTFCQNCLRRSIDTSLRCPQCRSPIKWPFEDGPSDHHDPVKSWSFNHHLASFISTCWRSWVVDRTMIVKVSERAVSLGMDLPIFVCTSSYPFQHTYLRIFEPRYRLMLRRVMQTESRTFGMVCYCPGESNNMAEYGTVLHIDWLQHTTDKDIVVRTSGTSRFKVKEARERDGYWTASVDPIVDTPMDLSYTDSSLSPASYACLYALGYRPDDVSIRWVSFVLTRYPNLISNLSNSQLLHIARQYVELRIDRANQEMVDHCFTGLGAPPEDDVEFVWWFAQIMEVAEDTGINLIQTTNIRERLVILTWWMMNNMPSGIIDEWYNR